MKTNPFYDSYQILGKVYSEGAHLKQALADTPIEELNRARTVKTTYGVLENEGYLSLCLRTFAPKNPKQNIRILLKIALYWLIFLKKPRYMVTDTAVDLCKRLGKGGNAGFVNAFLRAFDEEKVKVPSGREGLAVRSSFPLFAVKKICAEYGDRAESILFARSPGVTVRFERGEEKYLSEEHLDTPFEKCYIFGRFTRDANFFAGDYTFQSVGSQAICDSVKGCDRLLDACAAPGGKSVLLKKKCGSVTACEIYPHRAKLIGEYAARMGAELDIVECDSTVYRQEWKEAFDGVLCDVPCSGLGTAAENPDLLLRKTEEDFKKLAAVQYAILDNCSKYLKVGGYLTYSTCSILQEENDLIVEKFLKAHPEFQVVRLEGKLPYERKKYGLQYLPDEAFGAGFYVCQLQKT